MDDCVSVVRARTQTPRHPSCQPPNHPATQPLIHSHTHQPTSRHTRKRAHSSTTEHTPIHEATDAEAKAAEDFLQMCRDMDDDADEAEAAASGGGGGGGRNRRNRNRGRKRQANTDAPTLPAASEPPMVPQSKRAPKSALRQMFPTPVATPTSVAPSPSSAATPSTAGPSRITCVITGDKEADVGQIQRQLNQPPIL